MYIPITVEVCIAHFHNIGRGLERLYSDKWVYNLCAIAILCNKTATAFYILVVHRRNLSRPHHAIYSIGSSRTFFLPCNAFVFSPLVLLSVPPCSSDRHPFTTLVSSTQYSLPLRIPSIHPWSCPERPFVYKSSEHVYTYCVFGPPQDPMVREGQESGVDSHVVPTFLLTSERTYTSRSSTCRY